MKTKHIFAFLLFFAASVAYIGYWLAPLMFYREGFALFAFDSHFAASIISAPSGLIDYASQFVWQFFFHPWLGAVLTALILTYIGWGLSQWSTGPTAVSFIIPLWLLALLGDITSDMQSVVAIAVIVLAAQSTKWIKRWWYATIVVLIVSLISPPWVAILTTMIIVERLLDRCKERWLYVAATIAAMGAGMAVDYWLLYPTYTFVQLFSTNTPLAIALILTPLAGKLSIKLLEKRTVWNFALVLVGLVAVVLTSKLDSSMRSLLDMDSKIRKNNYQGVVDIAQNEKNLSRQHCFYVALAQAQLGTLGSELYKYPQQWGSDVLYHSFSNEPLELFMSGEMYSRLGHWNYAYRSAMEGVVINTRPSARMLSMMTRAAMANGESELFEKYMNTLNSTIFYRNAAHSVVKDIEKIRREMPQHNMSLGDGHNSYLFFSKAHQENPDNRIIYDYLLSDVMLKGRLDLFVKHLADAEKYYTDLPPLFQQATMVYWAQTGNGMELIDRYVGNEACNTYQEFTKIMGQAESRPMVQQEKIFEPYRDTYFYYIISQRAKK